MQRRQGAQSQRKYIKSGIPGHVAPGGKPKSQIPRIIRTLLMFAGVIVLGILIVFAVMSLVGGSGMPDPIAARPTDIMKPFGENLMVYDGMALRCIGPNGKQKWEFPLGVEGGFVCSKDRVIAWRDTQLHVLNKAGESTFNDRMEATIQFACVGSEYLAVSIGETKTDSVIRVFDHSGTQLEFIDDAIDGLYVLDMGFFTSGDKHLWVLSVDVDGNAPITSLKTYEPGRMTVGSIELDNELVYKVYSYNNDLMVVNTTKMQVYNYKCVEKLDIDPVLAYGWYVQDVRQVGKTIYTLLEEMPTGGDTTLFSELRLVTNSQTSMMRLLTPCFGSGLSEKGVYGIGDSMIYFAPYGQTLFKTFPMGYPIDGFVCMLDGGRAVIRTGNDIRILKLPT